MDEEGGGPNNQIVSIKRAADGRRQQSTATSTWWGSPRSCFGWVKTAVGLSKGHSYPELSPAEGVDRVVE